MNKRLVTLMTAWIVISVLVLGSAQPTPSSAQGEELVIWVRSDQHFNYEAIFGTFEQDYNLTIRVEVKPWTEIRDTYAEEASNGRGPDIFTGSDDWLWRYWDNGLLEPISLGPKATDYVPYAIETLTHNGQLYGVPYILENTAFIRNVDLVPDPPRTWDDVRKIAQDLVASGRVEYGFVQVDYDWYLVYPIMTAFGGYAFGRRPDGSFDASDIGLNNDGSVAALSWLREMVEGGLMPLGLDWETAHTTFAEGRAAMMISAASELWRFDETGLPYGVSPIPAGTQPGSSWVHTQAFFVNAISPHKAAAVDLLTEYIATEERMGIIAADMRRLSAHMVIFEQTTDPALLGFAEAMMNGQQYPNIPENDIVWGVYPGAIQQIKEGNLGAQMALDQAVGAIREQIGQ